MGHQTWDMQHGTWNPEDIGDKTSDIRQSDMKWEKKNQTRKLLDKKIRQKIGPNRTENRMKNGTRNGTKKNRAKNIRRKMDNKSDKTSDRKLDKRNKTKLDKKSDENRTLDIKHQILDIRYQKSAILDI